MRRRNGFALIQALFFMMFIMAVISVVMMMGSKRNINADAQSMAVDAYPVINAFVVYLESLSPQPALNVVIPAKEYFLEYPLSPDYLSHLENVDHFSDPNDNLTFTVLQ